MYLSQLQSGNFAFKNLLIGSEVSAERKCTWPRLRCCTVQEEYQLKPYCNTAHQINQLVLGSLITCEAESRNSVCKVSVSKQCSQPCSSPFLWVTEEERGNKGREVVGEGAKLLLINCLYLCQGSGLCSRVW